MNLANLLILGGLVLLLVFLGVTGQGSASNTEGISQPPYSTDIERDTLANTFYRKVLYTTPNQQLVLMSLLPREQIGLEQHHHLTQFIRSESGQGLAVINGQSYPLRNGEVVVVPPDAKHNIINLSDRERLQLYTIYSPPQHPPGTIHVHKSDDHEQ